MMIRLRSEGGSSCRRNTDLLCEADKFCNGRDAGFLHDAATMDLDGLLGGAQFQGDLLVQLAPHHPGQDLPLPRREAFGPGLERLNLFVVAPVRRLFLQGHPDRVEEGDDVIDSLREARQCLHSIARAGPALVEHHDA